MGMKPVPLRPERPDYETVWEAFSGCGWSLSVASLAALSFVHPDTVRDYLNRLVRGGYAIRLPEKPAAYSLIKRPEKAPRLRKDGSPVPEKPATGTDHLWRTIKMLSEFSVAELALYASTEDVPVKESTAASYVTALHRAGYLTVSKKAFNGGGKARYRLIPGRNTGPKAPKIQHTKAVYDPNLRKVVWTAAGGQTP